MPSSSARCPECHATLKLKEAVPPGRKLKCPKCRAVFPMPDEDDVPVARRAAREREDDRDEVLPARDDVDEVLPAKAVRKARSVEDDDRETTDDRRARKSSTSKQGMSKGLKIALTVAGVVVALCGGLGLGAYLIFGTHWREFSPPGGGCTVEMPGSPKAMPDAAPAPGITARRWAVILRLSEFGAVFAQWDISNEVMAQSSFNQLYRMHTDSAPVIEWRSSKGIFLNGHEGREADCFITAGYSVIRTYLVRRPEGSKYYILVTTIKDFNPNDERVKRFFDSFRIDGPPGPGPKTPTQPSSPAPAATPGTQPSTVPPDADAITRAIADLKTISPFKQRDAADSLARMAPDGRRKAEVVATLKAAIASANTHLSKVPMLKALIAWDTQGAEAVLIGVVQDTRGDFFTRKDALPLLANYKTSSAAAAVAAVLGEISLRGVASKALESMGDVAETHVISILSHQDVPTRAEACKILGAIGTTASTGPLRARTAQGENALVKRAAEEALRRLAARGVK